MAGNEWISGYLEAILDAGESINDYRMHDEGIGREGSTAAKYFVEEVVGHDEAALYSSWIKATATKSSQERSGRLENLCWRIWHITRKKKMIAWEDAKQLAQRHMERDQGRKYATEDMSEELSEGEKPDHFFDGPPLDSSNAISVSQASDGPKEQPKKRHLYVVLISLHGLVRGDNMELGRDSDTGGQVKYVVEFARALAMMPEVYRVDLLTRQICSPVVDCSYGEPTEMLTSGPCEDNQEVGESSGAYIVRIPCGPRDQYIRKELLWPYVQEFVDGALAHILNMAKALGEQISGGELIWPHVIHGHYADAGDIAALLSGALNVPMVITGHSLGRSKLEQLLVQGRQSEDINSTYKIMRRIEAEELALDAAELVITSTKQEIEQQWGLYDGFDVKMEKVLRARARRCVSSHGRYMPSMVVIPPGMDFSNMVDQDAGDILEGDLDTGPDGTALSPILPSANPPIWDEIMRFFSNPHKPMLLALARPDPKKNITTLLRAFGECRPLRELANLTLIMGNRDDIDDMSGGSGAVLMTALKLIDKYDLYGQVAYPKHHKQCDVPDIYGLAAKTKGVFINPALVEPFGLTLIEAAAHGLPMVATKNGGPVDIHRALNNGVLVDPHDHKAIGEALLKLVSDRILWNECRRNGLKNIHLYSWPQHCLTYLSRIKLCRMRHPHWMKQTTVNGGELDIKSQEDSLRDVNDISLHLSVDGEKLTGGSSTKQTNVEKVFENIDFVSGQKTNMEHVMEALNNHVQNECIQHGGHPGVAHSSGNPQPKVPILKRMKSLVVFAVDSYDTRTGKPSKGLFRIFQDLIKAVRESGAQSTAFAISTALSVLETLSMFNMNGISLQEFDALICGSGSELYYTGVAQNSEDTKCVSEATLILDLDYESHIDYRWAYEGLRTTMPRLMSPDGQASQRQGECPLVEEDNRCNSHCLAYNVTNLSVAPPVDELRQRLRMRGLRCHVIYCQNATRLHVLPLLASRAQALRYFFVRWGLDVANMYVIMGETGDTDYEEMISGTHKTIILKHAVEGGSEEKLRGSRNYQKADVAQSQGPNIVTTEEFTCASILHGLQRLGLNF